MKKPSLPSWLSWFIFICLLVSLSISGLFIVYAVIYGDNVVDYIFKVWGGGFALIALAIAIWRSMITEEQVQQFKEQSEKQAQGLKKQLAITSKGQYSDRFVKSVEQVASQNLAIRLGGLASLHALSKENKEEYQEVWAYLGSFLRHRRPLDNDKDEPTNPFPDVAYIAKMLRERDKKRIEDYESEFKLDLEGAHLEGTDLWEAHLDGAHLEGAHLDGADLWRAHLEEANLREAHLDGAHLWRANLRDAHLDGAHLEGAHLEGADLRSAHLEAADLREAHLEGADLKGAHLEGAHLRGAHLEAANLEGADLVGADLVGAHLTMANLSDVLFGKRNDAQDLTNLTPDQFKGTYYLDQNHYHAPKLPDNLPEECKPKPISYLEWDQIRAIAIGKVSWKAFS